MRVKCDACCLASVLNEGGKIVDVFFNYLTFIIEGKYVQSMEENLKNTKIS